jgi:hypothetical protein
MPMYCAKIPLCPRGRSRPRPGCLTPPNGAAALSMTRVPAEPAGFKALRVPDLIAARRNRRRDQAHHRGRCRK